MKRILRLSLSLLAATAQAADLRVLASKEAPAADARIPIRHERQDGSGNTRMRFVTDDTRNAKPDEVLGTHVFTRDRDLGQTFTVPAAGFWFDGVTVRTGPTADGVRPGARGAPVALQLLRVSGEPRIDDNGTVGDVEPPATVTRWATFAPHRADTDDVIVGERFEHLALWRGGVLPESLERDTYLTFTFGPAGRVWLEPGATYAFMLMFEAAGPDRAMSLANQFIGDHPGGHGVRREGSVDATTADLVARPGRQMIEDLGDPADVAEALAHARFPAELEARLHRAPGTIGLPDVCTYRDLVFFIHAAPEGRVEDLGKNLTPDDARTPAWARHDIPTVAQVLHGNTSLRNEAPGSLEWKGDPDGNGHGYYQRNRDLGQVFNVPPGPAVEVAALVVRTSLGQNAVMPGAPGAPVCAQLFEVVEESPGALRIDDNGTPVGTRSTHGFDRALPRTDDFIAGVRYLPLAVTAFGPLPGDLPVTSRPAYHRPGIEYGEQPGHVRFLRWSLPPGERWRLEGGRRHAFLLGFASPGMRRGLALAITTEVHTVADPVFVRDPLGAIRWGIRREGDGRLPPTMTGGTTPPADPARDAALRAESLFAPDHPRTLAPTSEGYPDVDTYRTLQFHLELAADPVPPPPGS